MAKSPLTDPSSDFPAWYQDVLAKAALAENGPVRGTMVIRPYGYAIWERIQAAIDSRIKHAGAENVYLPLFIPESYLQREAEHVEGFSPELAVVTIAGGKELSEPVIVRPTSETLFGEQMARWINSYRDLPLLLNQWANVVRWELRPRLFLRTSEFLWQEGHTAHADAADAAAYARRIHREVYEDFFRKELATPVYLGAKTRAERFAGAINTLTCEGIMRDGKALQLATSHELGQNFARAFDIAYADAAGETQLAWTTSWGSSTRMVGGLIMAHGDERGLRVPPRLAPIQAVVLVVRDEGEVLDRARELANALTAAGVRAKLDDAVHTGFGRRATDWELKGVPVRIDVGPRDLKEGNVAIVPPRRAPAPLGGDRAGRRARPGAAPGDPDGDARRGHALPRREHRGCRERARRPPRRGRRARQESPGAHSAPRVSGRCSIAASAYAASSARTARVPDSEDEPGLQAIVARAY